MTFLAAACGILIVLLGFWSTGRSPTDAQFAVEIVCLIGGLILCFLSVVLARLSALAQRLDGEPEAYVDDVEPVEAQEARPTPLARLAALRDKLSRLR